MTRMVALRSFPGPLKLGWDHWCGYSCDVCDRDLFMEWLIGEDERIGQMSEARWVAYWLRWSLPVWLHHRLVWAPTNFCRVLWTHRSVHTAWHYRWVHKSWYTNGGQET